MNNLIYGYNRDKDLSSVNHKLVSDELYLKAIQPLNDNPEGYTQYYKNCIIHLIDSVSRGYITPGEAYQALESDYFPETLTLRRSRYQHLIK